jgi:hypothetical protein
MSDEKLQLYHSLYKMVIFNLLRQQPTGELTVNLGPDREPGQIHHRTWKSPAGDRMVTLKLMEKS